MYCINCGQENHAQAQFCANCSTNLQPVLVETSVQEGSTTIATMQYAVLWVRVIASIIDGILVYIASMSLYLLLVFITGTIGSTGIIGSDEGIFWGIVIIGVLVILVLNPIYFILMESSSKQATLGKWALGIIVTDREGSRISFWRSVLRNIVKVISVAPYGILLIVSCFTIALTREKQALHDILARCHVMMKS